MPEKINQDRRRFLGAAALAAAGARFGIFGSALNLAACAATRLSKEGAMPSLANATAWINSPPLTTEGLHGKVVLVEFWTYTCINWLRTMPYVRAWDEKYRSKGLVVIGVHAPEFAFEKNLDNVRRAAKEMHVDFPIAVDSDHQIWRAFQNQYWPALYFVDTNGQIQHHQFGEGDYAGSERTIQRLLADAGATDVNRELVPGIGLGAEADADWGDLRSGENYLGVERTEGFASAAPGLEGRRMHALPSRLELNQWALSGDWTGHRDACAVNAAGGRLAYRFHARDLHLVMGPPMGTGPTRFRVRIDGRAPGAAHGVDVDAQGNGVADYQRMYQLIRQPKPIDDRTFEIEFLDPGAELYSFTFG